MCASHGRLSGVSLPALGNIIARNLGYRNLFVILISIPLEIVPEMGFLGTR